MHHGVKRLDAAVHHFGKAGQFANVLHRQASGTERFCGAASRYQFDMPCRERMAKLN